MSRAYPDPEALLFVVEVIWPTDEPCETARKRKVYIDAGILLWELYEQPESVHVYEPGQALRLLDIDDVLDGGVLAGFKLAVKTLFTE